MKIFLSWSGPRSREVAEALNDWLPRVIQAVRPFYSPEIEKGANWSNQIDAALEGTRFGVVCLTRDNLRSEWIHYEAGALSKTTDALVWTFLLDIEKGDVKPPLGKFQHTAAEESDVRELVRTINRRLADVGGSPLRDSVLDETFDDLWPRLQKRLDAARTIPDVDSGAPHVPRRDIHEMMEEALELLRQQQREFARSSNALLVASGHEPRRQLARRKYRVDVLAPVSPRLAAILIRVLEASDKLVGYSQSIHVDGSPKLILRVRPDMPRAEMEAICAAFAVALGEPVPRFLDPLAALESQPDTGDPTQLAAPRDETASAGPEASDPEFS